jgi:hypothetical protein
MANGIYKITEDFERELCDKFNWKKMKTILIIDAFINDDADEARLINFIDSSKNIGDDILLMSNTNISKTVQDKVDYFFYDKRNQLFKEEYDNYEDVNYYNLYEGFKVSNIFPHNQPHALSVLISLFRSVRIAKDLGYTHFYKMEYDARLGETTTNKIKEFNKDCIESGKKGIFYINEFFTHEPKCSMYVHYFLCEIDYFLDNFWNITCEQDYIDFLQTNYNNKNFLLMEYFMYENLKKLDPNEIIIHKNFLEEFKDTLWNSSQARVYLDKKYKECYTKFYLNPNNPDEIFIYSNNTKSEPTTRKIIITFNDETQTEITKEFSGYGVWSFYSCPNNVKKMDVYDEN